jgi:hypothetical protein
MDVMKHEKKRERRKKISLVIIKTEVNYISRKRHVNAL